MLPLQVSVHPLHNDRICYNVFIFFFSGITPSVQLSPTAAINRFLFSVGMWQE